MTLRAWSMHSPCGVQNATIHISLGVVLSLSWQNRAVFKQTRGDAFCKRTWMFARFRMGAAIHVEKRSKTTFSIFCPELVWVNTIVSEKTKQNALEFSCVSTCELPAHPL
eukprot:COSAG06_NODE_838_length_12005_cov_473.630354_13_plen_110_part_00